MQVKTSLKQ